MNEIQSAKEVCHANANKKTPRFNCELQPQRVTAVNVGVVQEQPVNTTRICWVPFLTNTCTLDAREELCLEVYAKTVEKPNAKRTWRDVWKTKEQKATRAVPKKRMMTNGQAAVDM